jgi:hypothetical protein
MNQPDAPHTARVTAAEALLNRGWGKPTTTVDVGEDLKKLICAWADD